MNRAQLLSMLDQLAPSDAAEATHRDRVRELVVHSDAPFSREQYVPGHVTASAFILSPAQDALLLILHEKLGRWLQPGGHVEPTDHDVAAAAAREVAEEVGLHDLPLSRPGIFDVDVHVIPARGSQAAHEHYDVRFAFQARDLSVRAGSDVRDARWVPLDAFAAAEGARADSVVTDDSVLRAVRKLRRGLR